MEPSSRVRVEVRHQEAKFKWMGMCGLWLSRELLAVTSYNACFSWVNLEFQQQSLDVAI